MQLAVNKQLTLQSFAPGFGYGLGVALGLALQGDQDRISISKLIEYLTERLPS